jgi:lincosamide nucleotidyltransferase A/C/D/E
VLEKDAVDVIALLEQNGFEVYVDGGWAVDALLGEQTRPHDDLDIALPHAQVPRLRALLSMRAFCEQRRDDSRECNFVLADEAGRRLDVHSYALEASPRVPAPLPGPQPPAPVCGKVDSVDVPFHLLSAVRRRAALSLLV